MQAGFGTVLSSPFYLNVINQGSNFNEDWPFYYSVEPTSFSAPVDFGRDFSDDEKENSVLGVEACMRVFTYFMPSVCVNCQRPL